MLDSGTALLYLRCRVYKNYDIILSDSVCKKVFHNFSLQNLGPIQQVFKVCNVTSMSYTESSIIYVHDVKQSQDLTLNMTNVDGSMLLNCKDSLTLVLMTSRGNPKAQLISIPADCQDVYQM